MTKQKGKNKKQNKVKPKFTRQDTITSSVDQPKESQVAKESGNGNGDSERQKVGISKSNTWTISDKINSVLTFFTFGLFFVAIWQGKQAQTSAIAAINADSIIMKQFVVANMPFLSIDKPVVDLRQPGQESTTEITIVNLGNYPIKVIGSGFISFYGNNNLALDTIIKKLDSINIEHESIYISKEFPQTQINTVFIPKSYDRYVIPMWHTYICGRVIYENPMNENKPRALDFIISFEIGKVGIYKQRYIVNYDL